MFIRVTQYLGDDVDRHPVFDRKRGERMSCAVESDRLCKEKRREED